MHLRCILIVVLLFGATHALAQNVSSDKGKLSYAIGYDFGGELKSRASEFEVETVIAAIRDSFSGRDPKVEIPQMRERLVEFQKKVRQEQVAAFQKLADENKSKSDSFLAENRGKSGVKVLPSGVQYRIVEPGKGRRPNLDNTVALHYRISKMDGREFDSSFARGTPMEMKVSELLKGWQEVLPLMETGAEWKVYAPPEMAFGLRGQPPVGPNEAVVFDLKLVEIK